MVLKTSRTSCVFSILQLMIISDCGNCLGELVIMEVDISIKYHGLCKNTELLAFLFVKVFEV